jgi:hypothetical protein
VVHSSRTEHGLRAVGDPHSTTDQEIPALRVRPTTLRYTHARTRIRGFFASGMERFGLAAAVEALPPVPSCTHRFFCSTQGSLTFSSLQHQPHCRLHFAHAHVGLTPPTMPCHDTITTLHTILLPRRSSGSSYCRTHLYSCSGSGHERMPLRRRFATAVPR